MSENIEEILKEIKEVTRDPMKSIEETIRDRVMKGNPDLFYIYIKGTTRYDNGIVIDTGPFSENKLVKGGLRKLLEYLKLENTYNRLILAAVRIYNIYLRDVLKMDYEIASRLEQYLTVGIPPKNVAMALNTEKVTDVKLLVHLLYRDGKVVKKEYKAKIENGRFVIKIPNEKIENPEKIGGILLDLQETGTSAI